MVDGQDAEPQESVSHEDQGPLVDPNPFAPVAAQSGEFTKQAVGPRLSTEFWLVLVVLLVASGVLIFASPFWGVALLVSSVMSGIRVPLLLRRFARMDLGVGSAQPVNCVLLLFTSMLLNLAMGGASLVTFVVICLPAGFISFSLFETKTSEASLLSAVFGGSALIALVVYFFLFRLSLRLNA